MGKAALQSAAALDAQLAAATALRRGVQRQRKIAGQKRARMAKNLRGFDDDDVVAMLGMRAILKEKANEKKLSSKARGKPLAARRGMAVVAVSLCCDRVGDEWQESQEGEEGRRQPSVRW